MDNNLDNLDAQNYAIAETVRADLNKISELRQTRNNQYFDIRDKAMKRKIGEYISVLDMLTKISSEIIELAKR